MVYGISWVSGYPCWFICQRNHIIEKHEIKKVLHVFICFKILKVNVEISCEYYIFQIFAIFWKYIFKMSFKLFHITVRWSVDSIENTIFRFILDISIERDWIASQFMLRSSLSLKQIFSCTKTRTPPLPYYSLSCLM